MIRKAKYKEEDGYLSTVPLPPQISSTGVEEITSQSHTSSFTEKPPPSQKSLRLN
jgi:hypothetical protein